MRIREILAAGAALTLAATAPATAQEEPEVEIGGLLRTGLRLQPEGSGTDGFEIYDARVRLSGEIGILFDWMAQTEYDPEADRVRLLDARLTLALRRGWLQLDAGQFKAPFGAETLLPKGDIQFVDRSQAALALDPNRQVGVQLRGKTPDTRLRWWGGISNGNGRTLENDDDSFLFAARAEYNTVGEIEFFEDFVVEVGANLAFSTDSALAVLPAADAGGPSALPFTGDRLLWGGDISVAWREYFFAAAYTRAEFERAGDAPVLPAPGGALAPGQELDAEGWYVEAGYTFFGAVDVLGRWDVFRAATATPGDGTSRFLVAGVNVYPGFYAKIGLQYAFGLQGTEVGRGLADDQFQVVFQLSF